MRCLVTGAGGFLGGYVVRELERRGHHVVGMVRPGSAVPSALVGAGHDILRADLRVADPSIEAALTSCGAVIHLAAGTAGRWRSGLETTVVATDNFLSAIDRTAWGGRFVHAGSLSSYALNQLPPGSRVDEDTPLEPYPGRRDDYAWCKMLQERQIAAAVAGGLDAVIVRPGAIFGPERRFQYRLGREIGGRAILLIGGTIPMPLAYVENVASLLVECVENPDAAGGVFNAVGEERLRQIDYLRRLLAARSRRTVVLPVPLVIYRAFSTLLDRARRRSNGRIRPPAFLDPYVTTPTFRRFVYAPSRAHAQLGWRAPVSMDEALERTFA